jgi:hypothetical protein
MMVEVAGETPGIMHAAPAGVLLCCTHSRNLGLGHPAYMPSALRRNSSLLRSICARASESSR